jgi:hypothetical protein
MGDVRNRSNLRLSFRLHRRHGRRFPKAMKTRAFRIYDKNSNIMLYPKDMARLGVFLDGSGEPVQLKRGVLSNTIAKLRNMVVMYDTGMRTPEGRAIWDGDIVDVDIPNEWGSLTRARGYMQWDSFNGRWLVRLLRSPLGQMLDAPVLATGVVGDIYQNPKLLEDATV